MSSDPVIMAPPDDVHIQLGRTTNYKYVSQQITFVK